MGPYSEQKQLERAGAIERLLEQNPDLDPSVKLMWQNKLKDLSVTEDEYNARVKAIYENMKREVIEYE